MTLASGAEFSIAGIEYRALEDPDEPSTGHDLTGLFANTSAIAGEIAKDQLNPDRLLWSLTDFIGGEGAVIYYPQNPTQYDVASLMNVTKRGQLTTRPKRRRSAVARAVSNASSDKRPYGTSAYLYAIIGWEDNIVVSSNCIGWSAAQDTSPAESTANYADAISDGTNAAFLVADGGTANTIPVVSADASITTWADTDSGTTVDFPIVGCVVDGVPYTLGLDTTLKVFKKAAVMDTAADWAGTTVFNTGITPAGTYNFHYWTSAVAAETASYFMYATRTHTFVWEVRADVGRQFWVGDPGFAGKKLIYKSGILFIMGNVSGSGTQFAQLYAIPLSTQSTVIAAEPRKHQNTELATFDVGCAGNGDYVYVADSGMGKIFVYDIRNDALSLFDDLANGGTGDGMAFLVGTNLLTPNQAGLEVDVTGWAALTNATTTRITTPRSGAGSLQTDPGSSDPGSSTTPIGTLGIPVKASTAYTALCYARSSAGTDQALVRITWYDSAGASISTSSGTPITLSATYAIMLVQATSPATAAFAAMVVEIDPTVGTENLITDSHSFHEGTEATEPSRIAFLAMHGSRLFGATYKPEIGADTSLQVFSYDDLEIASRDASQAISATLESADWDFGLPMELKGLIGFYVNFKVTDSATTSGLVANSRITVSYSADDATYVDTTVITSATTPTGVKGRVFVAAPTSTNTVNFNRLKVKITLDNNAQSTVAPPVLFSCIVEARPMSYTERWRLRVRIEDEEQNERTTLRANKAPYLRDALEDLVTNKDIVTFLDGSRYPWPHSTAQPGYTTHTVQVMEVSDRILAAAQGYADVTLHATTSP